jgi:hypothetical protein
MKLVEMDPDMETWGLGFVEEYGLLEGLEAHGLDELCQALQCLLREFPAGMTVFVVVDSVSCFDRDRVFEDWEYVVGCLGTIVEDEGMGVVLKVLLVNQGRSTLRVRRMHPFQEDPGRMICLSEDGSDSMEISGRVVDSRLRHARTVQGVGDCEGEVDYY